MIALGRGVPVFAYAEVVDMRKSFDTLGAIVREHMKRDVLDGALFVFVGRDRRRAKVLFWDGTGLCVLAKRLARGRFRMPRVPAGADRIVLDGTELAMLLGGFDVARAQRATAWEPKSRPSAA